MKVGCILCDRYEIISELGSGGMGRVYLARNISLGTLWAVKELHKSQDGLENVKAEVNVLKNLDHPSLLKVFDVIETQNSFYIIFTYIDGVSLNKKLNEVGNFEEETVINWGLALCDVLSYLHGLKPKPIIYRDLKPSNIMLSNDGSIKLIDFGIAREYKQGHNEDTVFIGTRGYAAPEQYGLGQSGPYTDIYSLGITLKHLLTGISPLADSSDNFLIERASAELIKIINKCTSQEIGNRYGSALELRDDLLWLHRNKESESNHSREIRTVYKKVKTVFYKQTVISLDNAQFASELAAAASQAGLEVLLVDTQRFASICDFYLGIQKKYREFTVMKTPEGVAIKNADRYMEELPEYIYPVPGMSLSFLLLNPGILCEDSTYKLLSKVSGFDLVIFSTSINNLNSSTKTLFNSVDKIIIPDEVSIDNINYWNYTIFLASKDFNINKGRVFYAGWLYDKGKPYILKDIRDILDDIKFIGTISDNNKRYYNINFSMGPAILNSRMAKKEYNRILFELKISPINYSESILSNVLSLIHIGRKRIEQKIDN